MCQNEYDDMDDGYYDYGEPKPYISGKMLFSLIKDFHSGNCNIDIPPNASFEVKENKKDDDWNRPQWYLDKLEQFKREDEERERVRKAAREKRLKVEEQRKMRLLEIEAEIYAAGVGCRAKIVELEEHIVEELSGLKALSMKLEKKRKEDYLNKKAKLNNTFLKKIDSLEKKREELIKNGEDSLVREIDDLIASTAKAYELDNYRIDNKYSYSDVKPDIKAERERIYARAMSMTVKYKVKCDEEIRILKEEEAEIRKLERISKRRKKRGRKINACLPEGYDELLDNLLQEDEAFAKRLEEDE